MRHLAFLIAVFLGAARLAAGPAPEAANYGSDAAVGKYADLDGIRLYYEIYGTGAPLLIIHGNGGSIADMAAQIDFFRRRYQVIAADSRGHGRSDLGPGRLTYEHQADDLSALLDQCHVRHAFILGASDGGILGLLLAIRHPDKVSHVAISGANLTPEGAYPWALAWVKKQNLFVDDMITRGDRSQDWPREKQHLDLLGRQPHISHAALHTITAPVLVMAGDRDVIRAEHTQEIFDNLPHAQLCIFPGATHFIPHDDPDLFNRTVEKFFSAPFARPETSDLIR